MADLSDDQIKAEILARIAKGEAKSYNTLYGGGTFQSFADHPRIGTVGPTGAPTHAAGLYQFQPATWDAQARKLGLVDFSPANQDAAAWDLAQSEYKRKTGKELADEWRKGNTDLGVLASTWPSLGKALPAASLPAGGAGVAGGPANAVGAVAGGAADAGAMAGQPSAMDGAKALRMLEMMQKLAPQHQFVPVDYDPWKFVPSANK